MAQLPEEVIANLTEGWDIECKLAHGQNGLGELPASFWETYSAFANTRGGKIILGVKENADGSFQPAPIPNADHVVKKIFDVACNKNKVSFNLLKESSVVQIPCGTSGSILVVEIPPASRKQKPIFLNGNPLGGNAYRRFDEGDRKLDDDSVKRMLAEQSLDERDSLILKGFSAGDLDPNSLAQFRLAFRDREPTHVFLQSDGVEFLSKLRAWRKDRETGEEGLTLAGLLMFGKWEALQEALPGYFLDYREPVSGSTAQRWADRIVSDGSWSGNLFDFYFRCYPRLVRDLKIPFELSGGVRKSDSPVHSALREAFVNCLVHADYSISSSIVVEKKPDEFEFRNPGGLRLPLAQALHGGESDCRNRAVHAMFMLIGIAEKAGSGVPEMMRGWASGHWIPPSILELQQPDRTVVTMPLVALVDPKLQEKLNLMFGARIAALTDHERMTLSLCAAEGSTSHPRVLGVTGLHSRDCTLLLQKLVKQGFLQASGSLRTRVYSLSEPSQLVTISGDLASSSGDLASSSGDLAPSSGDLAPSSGDLTPSSGEIQVIETIEALPKEEQERISELTISLETKGKLAQSEAEFVVLEICKNYHLSLALISKLIKKTPDHTRKEILNPLIEKGHLMRAREQPTHPKQGYKTNQSRSTP
jgi:ATP-dependent DNA helicase RecG